MCKRSIALTIFDKTRLVRGNFRPTPLPPAAVRLNAPNAVRLLSSERISLSNAYLVLPSVSQTRSSFPLPSLPRIWLHFASRRVLFCSASEDLVYFSLSLDYSRCRRTDDRALVRYVVTYNGCLPVSLCSLSLSLSSATACRGQTASPLSFFMRFNSPFCARSPLLLCPISAFTYYLRSRQPVLDYSERPVFIDTTAFSRILFPPVAGVLPLPSFPRGPRAQSSPCCARICDNRRLTISVGAHIRG